MHSMLWRAQDGEFLQFRDLVQRFSQLVVQLTPRTRALVLSGEFLQFHYLVSRLLQHVERCELVTEFSIDTTRWLRT